MFIVAATTTAVFGFMAIWVGSIVVLLVVRILVLLRRCRGRQDSRATTIITVIPYVLILAGMLMLLVSRYWWVLFVWLLLFSDVFLWLYFPVKHKSSAVTNEKCDLCAKGLYSRGKPHTVGGHWVCGECHKTIEEAKKDQTSR
jgi:hypothetical protein